MTDKGREQVTLTLPRWVASLLDPGVRATVILTLLVLAGFGLMIAGYVGDDHTRDVASELPWLISGGIGGLALAGLSAAALSAHLSRREEARHVHELAGFARELRSAVAQLAIPAKPARTRKK
ncbi:MAG TPA: hypothetical protein VHW74_15620 [Mycobacteriales bacterium]|jgi:hypothetical protein|nr:hypothetical protein [Mycobacteriales bacterium]